MSLDDLIKNVVAEPPRTVMVETKVLAPGRREEANRRGGMVLSELLTGATRGEPRAVRYGHILGPPASPAALNAWSERFPHHTLPADLRALVARVNGIHLWTDLVEGRSYEGLAPLSFAAMRTVLRRIAVVHGDLPRSAVEGCMPTSGSP